MQWGCEHERFARDKYQNKNSQHHSELEVMECGFHISTDFPFIGASPDGLVPCKCCGDGICEIKVKIYTIKYVQLTYDSITVSYSFLIVVRTKLYLLQLRKKKHFVCLN